MDTSQKELYSTLIEQVIDMMIGQARLKKLDLSFLIPNDIPIFLIGDPLKIRQILNNIINNAIKFTNTGHIFVSLKLINTTSTTANIISENKAGI
jgi:two-component system sensor histidine kinase BarA